jgi:DNA helicase-2/ATP-dependent DNA helicase PcrA
MSFTPSSHQLAIFNFVQFFDDHLVVEAVAGSGKTTTIIKALELIPDDKRVLFLAFNKHIVETLKTRVPLHVQVATLNGFGWQILRPTMNNPKINVDKTKNIFWYDILGEKERKEFGQHCSAVCKLVSLFKAYGMEDPRPKDVEFLVDHYDIETDMKGISYALQAHKIGHGKPRVVDFDDQLYLPIVRGLPIPRYDVVFVDETQDLNPIQIEMVKRIKGRLIAVGDSKQAIYGFRGADPEAMQHVIDAFHATTLPLSICFRCAKNIVVKAQEVVPYIEYAKDQIEGTVETMKAKDYRKVVTEKDFVLCRTTAPLVQEALIMLSQGRKACVLGRDIGKDILDLYKKIAGDNPLTSESIDAYEYQQAERLKDKETLLLRMHDQTDTLRALFYAYGSDGIEDAVIKLFQDAEQGIVYSTVHKAKGLERDRVFIICPELLPHPRCSGEWQHKQEQNLKYVAITRAKKELYFVTGVGVDKLQENADRACSSGIALDRHINHLESELQLANLALPNVMADQMGEADY